ncbi:MAG: VPLPA-CTERM sorting domain-containing protein [Pseudomonadota bacterium]
MANTLSSMSFLGVIFDEAVIASVSFEVGSSVFDGEGFLDPGDKVVMDDFIFGEPVPIDLAPVPLPAGAVLLLTGVAALGWRRKVQKS